MEKKFCHRQMNVQNCKYIESVRIWLLSLISGQSQSIWMEVSLSSPHNRQSGLSASPILKRGSISPETN